MSCTCDRPRLARLGLWSMPECRNYDLHEAVHNEPRVGNNWSVLRHAIRAELSAEVVAIAARLSPFLPDPPRFPAPVFGSAPKCFELDTLRTIIRDAAIEADDIVRAHPDADWHAARPHEELRAQVSVDHQLGGTTWRYPKRYSPTVWPSANRWHRQPMNRTIVRDIQAEAGRAIWQERFKKGTSTRVAEESVTLNVAVEETLGAPVGNGLGIWMPQTDNEALAQARVKSITAQTLELETAPAKEQRRNRRHRQRQQNRESGRTFLEQLQKGRR